MAEYLQPGCVKITERHFSLRNEMIEISDNFSTKMKKEICNCGEELSMKHMYTREYFNEVKNREKQIFEQIFKENITEQKEIYRIFEEKYRRKQEHINKIQTNVIFCKDPLSYTGTVMDE